MRPAAERWSAAVRICRKCLVNAVILRCFKPLAIFCWGLFFDMPCATINSHYPSASNSAVCLQSSITLNRRNMSKARLRSGRKKKTSWQWAVGLFLSVLIVSVIFLLIIAVQKAQLLDFLIENLMLDTKVLFLLILNVFIIGGVLLVSAFQWADHENTRFRTKQEAYRSMLVCKDYYRSIRRVRVDQAVVQVPESGLQKLDIDHNLKDSSLVTLGGSLIAKEARQTAVLFDENGRLSGIFKTYFTNGNILAEISYRNGMLNGRCVMYYPNGFLHNEKHFMNGKLDGVFRAWDESGSLFFEISYKDDIQHGPDRTYRKNGVVEYEDIYDWGKIVQRKTFDDMGRFKYVQNYTEEGAPAKAPCESE